jgi:hypothetical protein
MPRRCALAVQSYPRGWPDIGFWRVGSVAFARAQRHAVSVSLIIGY